ncbi:MAG TPA: glycosyltransferase [Acidimicrobiales bacterium]|nr:glycosyltransferase [Acidimicrobiales bacterium]
MPAPIHPDAGSTGDQRAAAPATTRLAVSITSNTLCFGGAERQRVVLANGLLRRGYDVRMVLIQDDGPLLGQLDPQVRVVRPRRFFNHTVSPHDGGVMVTGTTNTECSHACLWRYAAPRSRRWIVASHTPGTFLERTYEPILHHLIVRSDGLIALSERHAEALRAHEGFRLPTAIIPNGTDLAPAPRARSLPPGGLRFGVVGRLVPQKGIDLLLAALAGLPSDLPPWEVVVAGWGDELDGDRAEAVRLGLGGRVRWLGPVDFPQAIDAFDVLVLPSRSEALPMVLIEAMMSGVPVMASAVGSVPELLGHGRHGTLVEPTADAWRDALVRALGRELPLEQAADAALAHARVELTADAMVDRYARVIDDVAVTR